MLTGCEIRMKTAEKFGVPLGATSGPHFDNRPLLATVEGRLSISPTGSRFTITRRTTGRKSTRTTAAMAIPKRLHARFDRKLLGKLCTCAGIERLVGYMTRCPFSLSRLVKVTQTGQVIYKADKDACRAFPDPQDAELARGTQRNCQILDPLEFLAEFTRPGVPGAPFRRRPRT
jgi:hypothetical protein